MKTQDLGLESNLIKLNGSVARTIFVLLALSYVEEVEYFYGQKD